MEPTHLLQDELAAQEAAAREFQPRLDGPLVGERTPSTAISNEYAKADPVYVEKTLALPNLYSHYRPVQGDGNCGWRAIGFGYFETLIHNGDRNQVEAEVARITSLNQVLISTGYSTFVFEDMVEETVRLLKDIAARMMDPNAAMAVLMDRFNDRECSNALIYHFRLLAGACLKSYPAMYEPFIPADLGVAGYCSDVLERIDREIEHLGIILLVNMLLKPINLILEIAYLDRSPGSQVNIYRFPDGAETQEPAVGSVIYLLYRPDHYDLLYRPTVNIQVNRVASFSHQPIESHARLDAFSTVDFEPLNIIPGFSYASTSMSALESQGLSPTMGGGNFVAVGPSAWMHPSTFTSTRPCGGTDASALEASRCSWYSSRVSCTRSERSGYISIALQPGVFQARGSNFTEPGFTTAMFKNSHYNKAHYNNPDFHPEEWVPDDDCGERSGSSGGQGPRKLEISMSNDY
ncbi:unnamed protein product [Parascedosporium putredinis]|uniref:ubiquitinyl hydrolase 1 n=1 Tax=Parascedosporium putredinis TaxID=1442378 RepID=A0A9P1M6E5_9PEZI|nr:unnamed protein product [Parascedosporium putredinis]CAI7988315.1 unnamed protein product [Parascedosporium putredinis]